MTTFLIGFAAGVIATILTLGRLFVAVRKDHVKRGLDDEGEWVKKFDCEHEFITNTGMSPSYCRKCGKEWGY